MEEKFKIKKIIALIFALISGLSIFYSLFIPTNNSSILKEEIKITNCNPELKSKRIKNGRDYWLEFRFEGDYDKVYKIGSTALKHCRYHELKKDVHQYDTVILQANNDNYIFSFSFKGQNYLDKEKILTSIKENGKFSIFFRICIFFASLPILFFKRQPTFWHSGFEYNFSFVFLFFLILSTAVCIYFYINGVEYMIGLDVNTLT